MCGILGAFRNEADANPVNDWVLNQYEDQHKRGTEGFGAVFFDLKGHFVVKRATEPIKFLLDLNLTPATMIVAHHRTPTSSDNKIDQTHPMRVSNPELAFDYLVVHNGIINNAFKQKEIHEELGYTYATAYQEGKCGAWDYVTKSYGPTVWKTKFNDSETFAIEIARYIEGLSTELAIKGSTAFIAVQIEKATGKKKEKVNRVFFGRNTNPLHLAKNQHQTLLSSEGPGEDIEPDVLYSFPLTGEMKMDKKALKFHSFYTAPVPSKPVYSKDFKDYTPKDPPPALAPAAPASQIGFQTGEEDDLEYTKWREEASHDYPGDGGRRDKNRPKTDAWGDELEEDIEDSLQEIEGDIGDFMDVLRDPTQACAASVEDTLSLIAKSLTRAKRNACAHYDDLKLACCMGSEDSPHSYAG